MCKEMHCAVEWPGDLGIEPRARRKITQRVLRELVKVGCYGFRVVEDSPTRIHWAAMQPATARTLIRERNHWRESSIALVDEREQ